MDRSGPRQVTAETGKFCEVERERSTTAFSIAGVTNKFVKQRDFGVRQSYFGRRLWHRAVEHREPGNAPAENAEDRHQIGEPLGRRPRLS